MKTVNRIGLLVLVCVLTACTFNQKIQQEPNSVLTIVKDTSSNSSSIALLRDSTVLNNSPDSTFIVPAFHLDSTLSEKLVTSQIVKTDTLTSKGSKTNSTPIIIQLDADQEQEIRIRITRLERLLNSAWNKYYNIHTLLDRFVKLEATERLLHIHHYASSTNRMNKDQSGLQFIVQSSFPYHISNQEVQKDIIKIAQSFTHALLRYSSVSDSKLEQTDAQIAIYYEGDTTMQITQQLSSEFNQLKLPYSIEQKASNYSFLHITLRSNNFFQNDQQKWEATEQRIDKDIRLLKRRIEEGKEITLPKK